MYVVIIIYGYIKVTLYQRFIDLVNMLNMRNFPVGITPQPGYCETFLLYRVCKSYLSSFCQMIPQCVASQNCSPPPFFPLVDTFYCIFDNFGLKVNGTLGQNSTLAVEIDESHYQQHFSDSEKTFMEAKYNVIDWSFPVPTEFYDVLKNITVKN